MNNATSCAGVILSMTTEKRWIHYEWSPCFPLENYHRGLMRLAESTSCKASKLENFSCFNSLTVVFSQKILGQSLYSLLGNTFAKMKHVLLLTAKAHHSLIHELTLIPFFYCNIAKVSSGIFLTSDSRIRLHWFQVDLTGSLDCKFGEIKVIQRMYPTILHWWSQQSRQRMEWRGALFWACLVDTMLSVAFCWFTS